MLCFQRYLAIKHHHHLLYSSYTLGEQKRYTYKSFKDEVDSLAASLLELGFEKNDRFAVWLPNTSENVAMTFAASKLGLIKVKSFLNFPNTSVHNDHR
jgi:acyl-coenzyme A synthetase/AMP-(fatty) acid ligase